MAHIPDRVGTATRMQSMSSLPTSQNPSTELLVKAIQELSTARDFHAVTDIVRRTARQLTAADGAAFIVREGNLCHYVDEDAIGPLWKGQRFPVTACVSGWTMLHKEHAVVPDIFADARIPVEAYRQTFVKSMAMMPVRKTDPVGAIGVYWATRARSIRRGHCVSAGAGR